MPALKVKLTSPSAFAVAAGNCMVPKLGTTSSFGTNPAALTVTSVPTGPLDGDTLVILAVPDRVKSPPEIGFPKPSSILTSCTPAANTGSSTEEIGSSI